MSRRGRRAVLPSPTTSTARGLLGDSLVVRCFAQDGSACTDFDFARLPVAEPLQRGLAAAFDRRTAPGSRLTSVGAFRLAFSAAQGFAGYLAALPAPPERLSELTPEHIDGFIEHSEHRPAVARDMVGQIRLLLLVAEEISESVVARLHERGLPRCAPVDHVHSYSRAEFTRIAAAARADLRAAASRIRRNRALLQRYRAGDLADTDRRLELPDFVDRNCDVPRYRVVRSHTGKVRYETQGWVFAHGTVLDVVTQLHLSCQEASAGAVLLAAVTGQNPSVIAKTTAAHHRTDGHTGKPATAILDTHKPRRGRRAYMNLVLEQVPDWISIPDRPNALTARDELHTPFGIYSLLVELTSRSRQMADTDKLLLAYHVSGGGRGLRVIKLGFSDSMWSRRHNLRYDDNADGSTGSPLQVEMRRIRLTYLELHQKPVAHREETLAGNYLLPNRGNLAAYQKVVATALSEEVDKARAHGTVDRLSVDELNRARADPAAVAAEHGIDVTTLQRLMARELDTVMTACVDDGSGPHSTPEQPCRASFMQCLACPCARAMPHHLPIQVLVHDQLDARKLDLMPLTWTRRYGLPHTQLADLLSRHSASDVSDARAAITDTDRDLVQRFLNRELDIR